MGKLFKIIGIFIGVVLLLVVAASIILPMVISVDDVKGQIVQQVQKQTGRDLKIGGDLNLSVFPWLGIKISDVELSNAKGFGGKPFITVKHAEVRIKLVPLISSRLEVDTIELDGMTLNLARNKSGASNWDDLVHAAHGKDTNQASGRDKGEDDAGSAISLEGFYIGGMDINNARISWDDRQSGQQYEVSEFSLKSGAIVPDSPVALSMGMVLQSKDPAIKSRINLDGTIELNQAKGELSVADLKLTLDANGAALPQGALAAELQTALRFALDGSALSLQNLMVNSGDLKLAGNLNGRGLNTDAPVFSGRMDLAEFNLRDWMVLPQTADPKALGRFAASFNLTSKGQSTSLDNLNILLDDTKITGNAVTLGGSTTFMLDVDAIDLDRYMSADKAGGEQAAGQKSGAQTESEGEQIFPLNTMRKLDLKGSLQIGRLTANKLLAENVSITLTANNGLIQTRQKVGKFYQGSYSGSVDLNVKSSTPQININSTLANVNLGPLVKQLSGQDRITGKGNFNATLSASGNSDRSIRRSMNGKLDFKFLQGAIKGINLAEELRKAKALFSGKSVTASKEPVQTDFSQITASGVIKNGVLSSNDLQALSPFLRVTGEGAINLVTETLDYTATVFIVETSKGQGGHDLATLEELKRHKIGVPVRFKGPLSSPKWQVKWDKVLLDSQKEKLKSSLEKKLLGDEKKDGEEESDKDKLKRKLFKKLIH